LEGKDMSATSPKIHIEAPSADAWISPDSIRPNPDNPRIIFKQKELDALKQSIFEVGILQPLIVYEPKDSPRSYIIIDGERRWRCARELNLQQIPVHIHKEPTQVQNLTMMFNIHKLRVDWELMPTALSLNRLMELTGEYRVREVSRMTGLSESMVRKCTQLLSFSKRHQDLVLKHEIKDNLLLEIYPFLRRLERNLPNLLEGRDSEKIVDDIIDKEKSGHLRTVTDIRDLSKVVDAVRHGAPKKNIEKIVNRVLDEQSFEIKDAYSLVRSLYDVDHLTNQFSRLADEIDEFNPESVDRERLQHLSRSLGKLLNQLIKLSDKLSMLNKQ
jgi:ParB family chromosome partitioning protein